MGATHNTADAVWPEARLRSHILQGSRSSSCSRIGRFGSTQMRAVSGGQKQRVLLARALYRKPKILFLDEGTAHLDLEKEKDINERLRRLNITRVSVAHRPDMMAGTDAILRIGRASEMVGC